MGDCFSSKEILQDLYLESRKDKTVAQKCDTMKEKYKSYFEEEYKMYAGKDRIVYEKSVFLYNALLNFFNTEHLPLAVYISMSDCTRVKYSERVYAAYREGDVTDDFLRAVSDIFRVLKIEPEVKVACGARCYIGDLIKSKLKCKDIDNEKVLEKYFDDTKSIIENIKSGNESHDVVVCFPIETVYSYDNSGNSNDALGFTKFDIVVGVPVI